MYQGGEATLILAQLGSRFDNVLGSIKMYPSCGANHTSIAGALELIDQYDLKPDEVISVDVTMPPYAARLVGNAYDPSGDTQVAAQFSVRYSIARLPVRRRLGLAGNPAGCRTRYRDRPACGQSQSSYRSYAKRHARPYRVAHADKIAA